MKDSTVLKLAAICGVTILDSLVIVVLHINHTVLIGSVATIAGIAGYGVGNIRGIQKCKEKIQKMIPEVAEKIREWDCRG
jgi:hypothetical protein